MHNTHLNRAEGTSQSISKGNYLKWCGFFPAFGADVMLSSLLVHLQTSSTAHLSSPICSRVLRCAGALGSSSALSSVLEICPVLSWTGHQLQPHQTPLESFASFRVVLDLAWAGDRPSPGSRIAQHQHTRSLWSRYEFVHFSTPLNTWFSLLTV